ncbi:MAG: HD-GYP domain-containing protein [Deltaproteobacteria bacterium]|nr:HD-GYP domain-containing protein [Deltaproteobacteria bacterium]
MLKKIHINDLQIGMYVEKVDRSWIEIPFFKKHIQSPQQVEKLRKYHVDVLYVDTEKGDWAGSATVSPEFAPAPGKKGESESSSKQAKEIPSIFDPEEIRVAKALQRHAVECVKGVYRDIAEGGSPDLESAEEVVDRMIDHITHHPDVLFILSKLQDFDEYTFMHCVNVSTFSLILGKALHYTQSELKKLGVGALFHDVGKTRVNKEILNKPGKLDPAELKMIQRHPVFSVELLREIPGMNMESMQVALEHHERVSGKGYPRGLKGREISEFGKIAAIADVYDAMTTERVYQTKLMPYAAIARIYRMAKGNFEPGLVERFIARIGIYPVGTVVILSSGEIGVVTEIHRDHLLTPIVRIFVDPAGNPSENLNRIDLLHDKSHRRIKEVIHQDQAGISLNVLVDVPLKAEPESV